VPVAPSTIAGMSRNDREGVPESAVVVRFPELDELMDALRGRFALPRKPNGIAAHVTVIVPFLGRDELTEEHELPALRQLCANVGSFDVTFAQTGRFPHVLYLAPEPAEPFIAFTRAMLARWPQLRPPGGREKPIVPHLTVTTARPPKVFHQVEQALRPLLPIRARAESAQLYSFDGRRWTQEAQMPFAPEAGG
jgi:2'-5' RNA ligase